MTAQNHVSNLTEHYNVTVDQMKPMGELTVEGVPSIVTQGSNQTFSVSITMDISVEATIWYMKFNLSWAVYCKPFLYLILRFHSRISFQVKNCLFTLN